MTIQKAIRSGKPFRRKAWGRQFPVDWYIHPDHRSNITKHVYAFGSIFPSLGNPARDIHDILATDWEIKK